MRAQSSIANFCSCAHVIIVCLCTRSSLRPRTTLLRRLSMSIRIRSVIVSSFVADALSLGSHWVYNPGEIAEKITRCDSFTSPLARWHQAGGKKQAGDFTHYGDQSLLLLRSLDVNQGSFSVDDFMDRLRELYDRDDNALLSYKDSATRTTLAQLAAGAEVRSAASSSDDLGGPARFAPLFVLTKEPENEFVQLAKEFVGLTHGSSEALQVTEFVSRLVYRLLHSEYLTNVDELISLSREIAKDMNSDVVSKAMECALEMSAGGASDAEVVYQVGPACGISGAFPNALYFVFKYFNMEEALIANASVGGENAARAGIIAMILSAASAPSPFVERLAPEMKYWDEINASLERLVPV